MRDLRGSERNKGPLGSSQAHLLTPLRPLQMSRTLPNPDRLSFTPSHSLLNPKFESYKLAAPTLGDEAVSTYPLSKPFTFPTLPDHARLSYHEVAARASFTHLAAGKGGELLYVDGEGAVTAVEVDAKVRCFPSFPFSRSLFVCLLIASLYRPLNPYSTLSSAFPSPLLRPPLRSPNTPPPFPSLPPSGQSRPDAVLYTSFDSTAPPPHGREASSHPSR
jgi:hypothetical protein